MPFSSEETGRYERFSACGGSGSHDSAFAVNIGRTFDIGIVGAQIKVPKKLW